MIQQNDIIDTKHLTTSETDTINYGKTNSVEKSHPPVIDIAKAIIVSDLHLGYEKCNATALMDFLADNISKGISKEYSLFILGDLWDLWRKHDIIYSRESDSVLSLVNQFKDVYYLPGNHDHITLHKIMLILTVIILANSLGLTVERIISFLFMDMNLRYFIRFNIFVMF